MTRGKGRWLVAASAAGMVILAFSLSGCANLGYYWQSASGHMKLMNAARPVPEWLADSTTPEALKARLALSQRIRDFAVNELHLPDNPSYRRYADLHRSAAVWNVVAAPPYSLTLKTWCFPVTGCVGYRGYFDQAAAQAEADALRAEGMESSVYGVPAYSTLGWLNWLGGDPLLNTFIGYPEGELARLIFHELAHQVVYAKDDTMFNESFATAVERLGGQMWLGTRASDAARREYEQFDTRRKTFRGLLLDTRRQLQSVYGDESASTQDKEARKQRAMEDFRARYARIKQGWDGFAGYDPFVARTNNATLGAQAVYDELVPGFEALFEREGRNWPRFYDAVKKLAELPRAERHERLTAPMKTPAS
ncbi:aminopeptidase [Variovorax sp. VNK109]|uniref:aminopeptidase n=1 Tax=Variovorax sp. VNK109 TaxID=3400919 RepID=UPI003C0755ED